MGWVELIKLALQAIVEIPKVVERVLDAQRIAEMHARIAELQSAIDILSKAETKEERLRAIQALRISVNS